MSSQKKKTPAEELLESLMSEVGSDHEEGILNLDSSEESSSQVLGASIHKEEIEEKGFGTFDVHESDDHEVELEKTNIKPAKQNLQMTVIDPPKKVSQKTVIDTNQYSEKSKSAYEASSVDTFRSKSVKEVKVEDALAEMNKNVKEDTNLNTRVQNKIDPIPVQPQQVASMFSAPPPPSAPNNFQNPPPVPADIYPNDADGGGYDATKAIEGHSRILNGDSTVAVQSASSNYQPKPSIHEVPSVGDYEKTVAVTGFQIKPEENLEDRVKVSVGKQSRSSGYVSWNNGSVDGNLNQADNLRMAQEKIIELENENERIRRQNEELIAASEIIKERSDLVTVQLTEFKNDQDGLEQSFKNEMTLLKNHLNRKDAELQRAQFKVDELETKLKFDMKKIRIRERELENRLELVRAEKNAISKNKDEQILDLRRKMDILQMEVDSYRQKCVELNKQIENSQDSFKRTTRALRLAMANLELQEENKSQLKKAE